MKKHLAELIVIALTVLLITCFISYDHTNPNYHSQLNDTIALPQQKLAWGFPMDSITIDTAIVRSGQSLSDILQNKGISASTIDHLARNSKDIFDVRKIKSGNNYYLINRDSTPRPEVFVYDLSSIKYVVFELDSFSVLTGEKKIDTLSQSTAGTISSSLWNSLVENNSHPRLAVELADIFAWTIDFFGIQKGDSYTVLFDELYVEGRYVGIGQIHAANFTHMGETISAYYYNNNEQVGYFDEEGNSLRKAFLKAPLSYSRISSRFSNSRFHPVLKIRRPHHGVDYAAPKGTPVYSIGDGTIVKKGYQKRGGGNYMNIKHNSVYTSQYMHLNGYAKGIATGKRVKQGQLIGYVGMTGLATGPHLDFRIYKNGTPVDPLKVKAPPVEPILEANKISFVNTKDSLQKQLELITLPKKDVSLASEH